MDRRGTSRKTRLYVRGSKHNPYICDHCGYRSTRYGNMTAHLERVHGDFTTDPRRKSEAIRKGIVEKLKEWQGL